MSDERLRDDPREVCDHCDEQGSTIMQAKDDRYECIVCGERFRLVLAATPETPTLDVLAMALHESAIGCEQHEPYRVGHDLGPVTVHRVQAERLLARLTQSPS